MHHQILESITRSVWATLNPDSICIINEQERIILGVAALEGTGIGLNFDKLKSLCNYMITRSMPVLLKHTSLPIGKVLSWEEHQIGHKRAILIQGKLFNDYAYEEQIWKKVKANVFKGYSLGVRESSSSGSVESIHEVSLTDIPQWLSEVR